MAYTPDNDPTTREPIPSRLYGGEPFDLSGENLDSRYVEGVVNEGINIASSPIHIFKLLGIYEQNKLLDLTGKGQAISSGQYPEFVAENVIINDVTEWRSVQRGALIISGAYIGYDFGSIKLDNDRERYGIDTEIKYHVSSVMIQQGCNSKNRISKARVERSNDGIKWYGIALIDLPDDADGHWYDIKQSASSRYWRIRPLVFNGTANDFWTVRRLSLSENLKVDVTNVQDEICFLENRDRNYSTEPITVKGYYDFTEVQTELARFGIELTTQFVFKFGFSDIINKLGRPIIIGDILEVPSEIQYDINLKPIKKYLEVTDVGWSSVGYTPGWVPTVYNVIALPMIASQETQDITGDLNLPSTDNDFFNLKSSMFNTANLFVDQRVRAEANTKVTEVGTDTANEAVIPEETVQYGLKLGINLNKLNVDQKALYIEDGLPPGGIPFTEGPTFPSHPKDDDYHRMTYEGLKDPIPPRLFRYSLAKMRWIFMEEDKRMRSNTRKPQLTPYLNNGVDVNTIGK